MTDQTQHSIPGRGTTATAAPPAGVAVVDIWTFSVEATPDFELPDVTGFSVEATDGHIGKINEATRETGGSYLIVDTGPWIFGKKVMLPAGVVEGIDTESKTVYVNRSKEEIKNAPQFDEKAGRQDKNYRERLGSYYS
jgi:PRC-barrel domain protein